MTPPCPEHPAHLFAVGTKAVGRDAHRWIIVKNKKGNKTWKPVVEHFRKIFD